MLKVREQSDAVRGLAQLRLRIAAFAIDWLIQFLVLLVVFFAAIDNTGVVAIANAGWQEWLDDLWFADFALAMYWGGLTTLVFRLAASVVFGTTPGRKLTGLRIGADADGRPAGRGLIALRDLFALVLFAIPVLNVAWIVLLLRDSKKPGWHERLAGTTVAQRSRTPRNVVDSGPPDSRPLPPRDAHKPFATGDSAALEATERTDSEREMAPLGLRIGAFAIDAWVLLAAMSVFPLPEIPEVSEPVDPIVIRNLLRILVVVLAVIGVYVLVISILAFRFLICLLFGTTPGRKITGLRIVTDLGGLPVGRARLAFREFLAGLFFSLPVVNIFWLVLIVRHSRSPGWHEEASKTAVVQRL